MTHMKSLFQRMMETSVLLFIAAITVIGTVFVAYAFTEPPQPPSSYVHTDTSRVVFTKCQVKHSPTAVYPSCPSGYTNIHTYQMARISDESIYAGNGTGYGYRGITYINVDDSTSWFYQFPSVSSLACTVCQSD